jgi:hypothetical protein
MRQKRSGKTNNRLTYNRAFAKGRWNFTFQSYQSFQSVTEENEGNGEKAIRQKMFLHQDRKERQASRSPSIPLSV